ncbi:MAG: MoaD/ThiS family protein [Planctomycetaceae bacterium]|jgi:molybdopterin converting factor subunit 1|nr:MoaD/ThiS family protein [Planctomycetaceae bacterium]
MKIAVKLFARARDLAGTESMTVDIPAEGTVASLRGAMREVCPALAPLTPHLFVAINAQYAGDTVTIRPSDEVACFPPVSGG